MHNIINKKYLSLNYFDVLEVLDLANPILTPSGEKVKREIREVSINGLFSDGKLFAEFSLSHVGSIRKSNYSNPVGAVSFVHLDAKDMSEVLKKTKAKKDLRSEEMVFIVKLVGDNNYYLGSLDALNNEAHSTALGGSVNSWSKAIFASYDGKKIKKVTKNKIELNYEITEVGIINDYLNKYVSNLLSKHGFTFKGVFEDIEKELETNIELVQYRYGSLYYSLGQINYIIEAVKKIKGDKETQAEIFAAHVYATKIKSMVISAFCNTQ